MSNAALAALINRQGEASGSHFDDLDTSLPDFPELGSLQSSFQSPTTRRLPIPSALANTTPSHSFSRKYSSKSNGSGILDDTQEETPHATRATTRLFDETDDTGPGSFADTPIREKSFSLYNDTPMAGLKGKKTRASLGGSGKGPTSLTLREQEKVIDDYKKDNFSLKLKVHFLEERLNQLAPEQLLAAAQHNTQLKVEVAARGRELKQLKKLVLELERELEAIGKEQGRGGPASDLIKERYQSSIDDRDAEIRDLRRKLKQQEDAASNRSMGSGSRSQSHRKLEEENAQLREQNDALYAEIEEMKINLSETTEEMLAGHEAAPAFKERIAGLEDRIDEFERAAQETESDRQFLSDELEAARAQLDDLRTRREYENQERSVSVLEMMGDREEREALHNELGEIRDRLAAANIELDQKENDLAESQRHIKDLEHAYDIQQQDLVAREEELVAYERALVELQDEHAVCAEDRQTLKVDMENELSFANEEIKRLAESLAAVEIEAERFRKEADELQEARQIDREHHEDVVNGLKDRLAVVKSQCDEIAESYEVARDELGEVNHRLKKYQTVEDDLSRHIEELEDALDAEKRARDAAELDIRDMEDKMTEAEKRFKMEISSLKKDMEERERVWKRDVLALEAALKDKAAELESSRKSLHQRKSDIAKLQSALNDADARSRQIGENHTSDRFSLELELERTRKDLTRTEDDLERVKKELADKDSKARQRENDIDQLYADRRELESKLAAQTQARLNLSEKLDSILASTKGTESEAAALKAKVADLEHRLSKEQRELLGAEKQYRDQLTERNTLLLTVWQYIDQILGVEKTPKKGTAAQTKPFTNFAVFHENMTSRLKTLSNLRGEFDRRVKEADKRFTDRLDSLRRELDSRVKHIDKVEAGLMKLPEQRQNWRRKAQDLQGQLDASKKNGDDLQKELASLRRLGTSTPGELAELRALSTKLKNAENRALVAENLKSKAERDLAYHQEKQASEVKHFEQTRQIFEDRVKEYQRNEKLSEERIKREKQGGKERIRELEKQVQLLAKEKEDAVTRARKLDVVMDKAKAGGSG